MTFGKKLVTFAQGLIAGSGVLGFGTFLVFAPACWLVSMPFLTIEQWVVLGIASLVAVLFEPRR